MANKSQVTKDRDALHTGVYGLFGDVKTTYQTLAELKSDTDVEVFEVGFDQRQSTLEGINLANVSSNSTLPFRCAVAVRDDGIELANMINREFLGNGSSSLAIRPNLYDKSIIYNRLKSASIAVANFDTAKSDSELEAILTSGKYSQGHYIIKPSMGTNAIGVYRSKPDETPTESLKNYKAANRWSSELISSGEASVVMEYVDWDGEPVEVSVDGIVVEGRLVFHAVHEKIKLSTEAPFRVTQMVFPPISARIVDRLSAISDTAQSSVSALDLANGVIHFEFRLTSDEIFPVDLAFRPGAGFTPHAVLRLTGVDLRLAHFASHLGLLDANKYQPETISGGTCIGALYASTQSRISQTTLREIAQDLSDKNVFASNVRSSIIEDPLWIPDVAISIGVFGQTVEEAMDWFAGFARKYSLE